MAAFNDIVNFDKAVSLEQSFDMEIPAELFKRLLASVVALRSPIHASYSFFKDPQGLRTIAGYIESPRTVFRCERCGGEFERSVRAEFSSTCDEQKVKQLRLEDKFDLVEITPAGDFALLEYLEDCLMLELPYAPKHEEDDPACLGTVSWSYGELPDEGPSPFVKALGDLKDKMKF